MKRKAFIKNTSLLSIGLVSIPSLAFSGFTSEYTREQLIGKGNPDITGDTYTSKMHRATAAALKQMKLAARSEGINIEVVSAYRSFQRQKEIYEGKYRKYTSDGDGPERAIERIIEYSTIPGTSRHHWGTDLDLIDANAPQPKNLLQAQNYHGKGPFCKLKEWLDKHAESFDFFEVYTDDHNRKGFSYEPWHLSYAPISIPMLQAYRQLDLKKVLQEEMILGSEFFTDDFISKYRKQHILDINPRLLS
ncbi:MAG: M15 family metallopeptidase [Flavobacteriaceae bacterium]|nr:M15 family metallopeptidase [Flavobacteriaceae bacterium]